MLRRLPVLLRLYAAALVLSFIASCDVDLFGFDPKHLAGQYWLSLTDGPDRCAVKLKRDFITSNLELIGWQKPIILCQTADTTTWDVIETDSGRQFQISDDERRTNPRYRSIELRPAIDAWKSLSYHKRLW